MPNSGITISVLAGLDVDDHQLGMTKEGRQKVAARVQDEAHKIVALRPYAVGPCMVELLSDALRKPVAEALGEIWKQRREIREAVAKGERAPNAKAEVSLFTHSATWALKPSITVKVTTVPKLPPFTIHFLVRVTLTLENVTMVIERAHITKFTTGKLASKVELEGEDEPLMAPFEKSVDLPGELVLPGGGIDLS